MITADSLSTAIKQNLNASHVNVEDTSGGCGSAFNVIIVSDAFKGMNRLARHRLVNSKLKDEIASMHAFSQKNFTSEEWTAQS